MATKSDVSAPSFGCTNVYFYGCQTRSKFQVFAWCWPFRHSVCRYLDDRIVETDHWVLFWQDCLSELEKSNPDENQATVFSGSKLKAADHRPTFNQILWVLAIVIALIWFGVIVKAFVS